ncbi:MAG: Stp1/IreP family PP2C-type Ser/Thr phosphatase [Oscillospiraceae bacterium]|nr:Stp1/IreP family PP2C-type Ser/Thr phosphatase [Oscillospiraceae bacterium]
MLVEGRTHIGPVRKENQDDFRIKIFDDKTALAIVCDGMGGASSGKEASGMAVNTIYDRITSGYKSKMEVNSIKNLLLTAVNASNSIVYTESVKDMQKNGMGTTCVAAIVKNDVACIASVGDSRAYVINSTGISQITNDHTYVEMLYEQGKITKEQINQHKMRHVITKAIGTESDIDVDYFEIDLEKDSVLLLCTDGLTGYCSNELIFNFVYQKELSQAADELIDYVNTHGGKDNITVVMIRN